LDELLNLLEDPKTKKIDHPASARSVVDGRSIPGTKDVSDCVAGVCHSIMEDETLLAAPVGAVEQVPRKERELQDPGDFSWIIERNSPRRITGVR